MWRRRGGAVERRISSELKWENELTERSASGGLQIEEMLPVRQFSFQNPQCESIFRVQFQIGNCLSWFLLHVLFLFRWCEDASLRLLTPFVCPQVHNHCCVVSPLTSMPCCCSCARSSALSFFSSSICCLSSSLSISTRSTSLKLSCSRWLFWRSSRM